MDRNMTEQELGHRGKKHERTTSRDEDTVTWEMAWVSVPYGLEMEPPLGEDDSVSIKITN
jgi:hypothetical protein